MPKYIMLMFVILKRPHAHRRLLRWQIRIAISLIGMIKGGRHDEVGLAVVAAVDHIRISRTVG